MSRLTLPDVIRALPPSIRFGREISRLPTLDAMHRYLLDSLPPPEKASEPSSFLLPSIYPAIVTEKDLYLASVLRECRGRTIVAVVGLGHLPGITQHLPDRDDGYLLRAELSITPPLTRSPLVQQCALAGGAIVAGTTAVAAAMARALNRNRTTRKFRGTLPITLLLLGLEVGGVATWLSKEWLGIHVAVTQAVQEHRDHEEYSPSSLTPPSPSPSSSSSNHDSPNNSPTAPSLSSHFPSPPAPAPTTTTTTTATTTTTFPSPAIPSTSTRSTNNNNNNNNS
jgi:hypothetical protein